MFKVYGVPLNPIVFHSFFFPNMKEEGVFFFNARPRSDFLDGYPTSHMGWKDKFFFLRPPSPFKFPFGWRRELPTQPLLELYKEDSAIIEPAELLQGLKYDVERLVGEEGFLYRARLSPIATELSQPIGKTQHLLGLCKN